jgi:hypothetical protein
MEDKRMTRSENILEEYRIGDLEKRLNLFLECPALRSRFLEIDRSETTGEFLSVNSQKEVLGVQES